jgi:hypothetical protein
MEVVARPRDMKRLAQLLRGTGTRGVGVGDLHGVSVGDLRDEGPREPDAELPMPDCNSPARPPPEPWTVLLEGRLGVAVHDDEAHTFRQIREHPDVYFCSTNMHEDWDVDLAAVASFAAYLRKKRKQLGPVPRLIVYYTRGEARHLVNVGLLLGAYLTVWCGVGVDEAAQRLRRLPAWPSETVDALRGLQRAIVLRVASPRDLDVPSFELLARRPFPDTTTVGRKFLLLGSPGGRTRDYARFFHDVGVRAVVRVTDGSDYEGTALSARGLVLHNLFTPRDEHPTAWASREFLNICLHEKELAVHCWDGRGNAALLVALWLMRALRFSAAEAIALLQLLRPGALPPPKAEFLRRCDSLRWRGNLPLLPGVAAPAPPCRVI